MNDILVDVNMNPKFKYIHYNFGTLSIFPEPVKPSGLIEKLFDIKTINEKISLNDIIEKCKKHKIDFENCYINIDEYSDECKIYFYRKIENKKYKKDIIKYEKDLKEYNEELVIFEKIKKEEQEEKNKKERENKLKLFNELKKELGM